MQLKIKDSNINKSDISSETDSDQSYDEDEERQAAGPLDDIHGIDR